MVNTQMLLEDYKVVIKAEWPCLNELSETELNLDSIKLSSCSTLIFLCMWCHQKEVDCVCSLTSHPLTMWLNRSSLHCTYDLLSSVEHPVSSCLLSLYQKCLFSFLCILWLIFLLGNLCKRSFNRWPWSLTPTSGGDLVATHCLVNK